MSAPTKPWEHDRYNQGRVLQSSSPMIQAIPGPSGSSRMRTGPPGVPPRPNTNAMQSNYMGSSSYGGYGRGMGYNQYNSYNNYGGYGGYGNLGGYSAGMFGGYGGGMYGNNGFGFGPESRFIQMAEESTRPAFQGIESLVRAFGSIAMMFDSTYFAVQSSFRAVLGVAENLGRIRTMFGQIWSSFALLRFFRWLYNKMLSLFGYKVTQDLGKAAWNEAIREGSPDGLQTQNTSSWPIFMFLGMIISAPYLISKLLPPLIDKHDPKNWSSPGKPVIVVHPFQATNPLELTIQPGDSIMIAPLSIQREMNLANSGWAYAASARGVGIIPVNYIQPVTKNRGRNAESTTATAVPTASLETPPEEAVVCTEEELKKLGEEFEKADQSSQSEPNANKNSEH